jgi:hypothetical protein
MEIFKTVRMISVSRLAQRLHVDRTGVESMLPAWKESGIIRIVNGTGCGSCTGCGPCSPGVGNAAAEEKMLVSLVKQ